MNKTSHRLRARLSLALGLPLLGIGCWEEVHEQKTHTLYPKEGAPCPAKEEVPVGQSLGGNRCHPATLISVDEGPVVREAKDFRGDPVLVCDYLATFEQTYTISNSLCIGSGRPLFALYLRVAQGVRDDAWT